MTHIPPFYRLQNDSLLSDQRIYFSKNRRKGTSPNLPVCNQVTNAQPLFAWVQGMLFCEKAARNLYLRALYEVYPRN